VATLAGAVWLWGRDARHAPMSEIDAASRAQLERVLEQADRDGTVR
jgi:hypothetical protein